MRLSLLWLPVFIAAAFFVGRETGPDSATASSIGRVYTGRQGDVFRVPSAATRCVVTHEAGLPRLYCTRIRGGRYMVDFFNERIFVWRNGNPDNPAFAARWKP